jgi:hypothetical protein
MLMVVNAGYVPAFPVYVLDIFQTREGIPARFTTEHPMRGWNGKV